MQQPCLRCGYVSEQLSDRPVRFCRQCGAPLIAESDVTAAETRNYGQPNTNEQFADRPFTPRWAEPATSQPPPETVRFYQSPSMQGAPPLQPAYAQPPAPKKSRAGLWLLIAFLSLLLVGGTMAAITAVVLNSNRRGRVDRRDQPIGLPERPSVPSEPNAPGEEASGKEDLPKSLQKYFYPGAEVATAVEAMGQEVVELETNDEVSQVGEYYRKLVGNPITREPNPKGGSYVFQVTGSPSVMITVSADHVSRKTKVALIGSNFIPDLK